MKQYNYFIATISTQYDGLEFYQKDICKASDIDEAQSIFEKRDYTHQDGIEEQQIEMMQEITLEDYLVLEKYL